MKIRSTLLAALAVILSATAAIAAPPPAPVQVYARAYDIGTGYYSIHTSWMMESQNNSVGITHYRVYGRMVGTSFELIDTVNVYAPNSDSLYGSSNWHVNTSGTYQIYVTAVNGDGESSPSDTAEVVVAIPPIRFVNIHNHFNDSVTAGSELVYDIDAVANGGGEVRFGVFSLNHTATATIDSITGEFRFTPTAPGYYSFGIVAWLAAAPTVRDTAMLTIYAADPNQLHFISSGLTARVDTGVTVSHTFEATGGSGVTVTYRMISISNESTIDVTLDSVTGAASFTPHAYGMYQFQIGAFANNSAQPSTTQGGYIEAFDINSQPVYLMGSVLDSSNWSGVPSMVRAYRRTGNSNNTISYTLEDSMQTSNSHGNNFSFRALPGGAYVLHATPDDTNHAAAYYRAGMEVALTWEEATVVSNMQNQHDSIVIIVPNITGTGTNRLIGTVLTSGGRTDRRDGRSLAGADVPLAGARVYAVDANGSVAGIDVTDIDGNYEITRLGAGTFTVLVDAINYTAPAGTATFAVDYGLTEDVDVTAQSVEGTSGVLIDPARVELGRTWPTPSRDRAHIRYIGTPGPAELTVVDAAGSVAMRSSLGSTSGENLVELNTSGLAAGAYTVRIVLANRVISAPLVIIR